MWFHDLKEWQKIALFIFLLALGFLCELLEKVVNAHILKSVLDS